jgi:hypothetical protein
VPATAIKLHLLKRERKGVTGVPLKTDAERLASLGLGGANGNTLGVLVDDKVDKPCMLM